MIVSNEIGDVLMVIVFLATPLVFAASLYFQDKNRSTGWPVRPTKNRLP